MLATRLRLSVPVVVITSSLACGASARAQELTPESVAQAMERGAAWLRARQNGDGAFRVQGGNGMQGPGGLESTYPLGSTALATLTLLKTGTAPDDAGIERAFQWMYMQPLEKTYEVSMLVLAIEARFAPPKDVLEREEARRGYGTVARRHWAKIARPVDVKKLEDCAQWLITHRATAAWRYPGAAGDGALEDHSATQYAMLALKSASRLGCAVPLELWEKVADHFVAQQDPTGEEVPWFAVPSADGPIQDMVAPERRRTGDDGGARGGNTRERGTPRTGERPTMHARGWSYLPRPTGSAGSGTESAPAQGGSMERVSTGSMTASGIAALVIAKSELELHKTAWSRRQPAVEQAIRDGCAWLASKFIPSANPTARPNMTTSWTFYYLYGCERAGVLAGTYRFGPHDWWDEGAVWLLGQQGADGAWPVEQALSHQADTCFALLFLARATVPLVPLPPKRVMTGGGRQ